MWWRLAATHHNWTIAQWEALPARHRRFYIECWHEEGWWKTADEAADDPDTGLQPGREFEREQLVSTQQQMNPGANITVGPIVDASQLAPHEWPGEVIDLRRR